MKRLNLNKKGFTLVELLAVIVVLALLLFIAIPIVSKYIEKTKKQAFFANVSNIVNSIAPEQILNEKEMCIYDYSKDEKNKVENIKSMYILAHKDSTKDKTIYSVFASMDGTSTTIDIYDFSTLNSNNISNWAQHETSNTSYTYYATSLLVDSNKQSELFSYKVCDLN